MATTQRQLSRHGVRTVGKRLELKLGLIETCRLIVYIEALDLPRRIQIDVEPVGHFARFWARASFESEIQAVAISVVADLILFLSEIGDQKTHFGRLRDPRIN